MQDTLGGKTHVLRSFPGNVWAPSHLSRCCYFPPRVPKLEIVYWSWNWDKDTITKAQGLKASLLSFQTVVVFIATRNTLDEVKALASKLQKRDQDIFEAYMMADEVIGNIKSVRKNIDSDFQVWYKQILDLAEKLGIVEASLRKTSSILRNRSKIPSWSLQKICGYSPSWFSDYSNARPIFWRRSPHPSLALSSTLYHS